MNLMLKTKLQVKKIKNIVFDFGGVLLDLDIERSFIELAMVLDMDTNDLQILVDKMMPYLSRYEKGEINSETFIWHVQKLTAKQVDPRELIAAWNAMLLGWNPLKLKQLEELGSKFNLYLFSNTNELHMQWVLKDLRTNHGITDFDERFFIKAYYSYKVGKRKPDAETYQFILDDAGILAEESMFIDDSEQNAMAAGEAGFQAIHHPTNAGLEFLFDL